jgi:hypothetical protein
VIQRDLAILRALEKFRVMCRDHIARLFFSDVSNPIVSTNRVIKRLIRDGYAVAVPQENGKPYLYMPNPTIIHPRSRRIEHFLKIVDLYIETCLPDHFDVEPTFSNEYRPDVYATINGERMVIEVQRTRISNRKMQEKVDAFMRSYYMKEHDARTMWICASMRYDVSVESGFKVIIGEEI